MLTRCIKYSTTSISDAVKVFFDPSTTPKHQFRPAQAILFGGSFSP
jgi:hypothetical protein